jgi:hypothetical protein
MNCTLNESLFGFLIFNQFDDKSHFFSTDFCVTCRKALFWPETNYNLLFFRKNEKCSEREDKERKDEEREERTRKER